MNHREAKMLAADIFISAPVMLLKAVRAAFKYVQGPPKRKTLELFNSSPAPLAGDVVDLLSLLLETPSRAKMRRKMTRTQLLVEDWCWWQVRAPWEEAWKSVGVGQARVQEGPVQLMAGTRDRVMGAP